MASPPSGNRRAAVVACLGLLACNPVTTRPPFDPLPAVLEAELELPVATAIDVMADAFRADSIPVTIVRREDGYFETDWFLARDGTVTRSRPLGVEVVRVRGWATPGRVGHTDIQVEAVYRPMADPSRSDRELERLVSPEHPLALRLEGVMARLVTQFGHPEQLAPTRTPATVPDTGGRRPPAVPPDTVARPDTIPPGWTGPVGQGRGRVPWGT